MLKSKFLESHNFIHKIIFESTIINIALKIKDIEKTSIIFSKLDLVKFVLIIINPNSTNKKKYKNFSNIKKSFPIKIVLIIIQKNVISITLGISKIFYFSNILLLNKAQLIAAIANGIQEPNGAITTTGQINNETTIKVL